jgi:hypothetical protein
MNILGDIGGLLSLLTFFGALLAEPFNNFSKNFLMLDELFSF